MENVPQLSLLEQSILSYILNGMSMLDMISLTGLHGLAIRETINTMYSKFDYDFEYEKQKVHLQFKLLKKKRRFRL